MSPYISGFLIFLIIALYLGAFLCLLKNKSLKLNEKSLDKQPLFWFAVLSPIVLFLIFGVIIWKDYIPDLSKAGLESFAKISTFPLAILTLSPILGVIVSNIHKSIQTEKQIFVTEHKNKADFIKLRLERIYDIISAITVKTQTNNKIGNVYKYYNMLSVDIYKVKLEIERNYEGEYIKCKNIHRLMHFLYPFDENSTFTDLSVSNDFLNLCIKKLNEMNKHLSKKIQSLNFGKVVDVRQHEYDFSDKYNIGLLSNFLYLNFEDVFNIDVDFDFNLILTSDEIFFYNEKIINSDFLNYEAREKYNEIINKSIYTYEMSERCAEMVNVSTTFLNIIITTFNLTNFSIESSQLTDEINDVIESIKDKTDILLQSSMKLLCCILNKDSLPF